MVAAAQGNTSPGTGYFSVTEDTVDRGSTKSNTSPVCLPVLALEADFHLCAALGIQGAVDVERGSGSKGEGHARFNGQGRTVSHRNRTSYSERCIQQRPGGIAVDQLGRNRGIGKKKAWSTTQQQDKRKNNETP